MGFKVFKLDSSNLKVWDDTPVEDGDAEGLVNRMAEYADGIKAERGELDLAYEILLKMGYPLTAGLSAFETEGLRIYKVSDGEMLICLQSGITTEGVEKMAALRPRKIVTADSAFADSSAMWNAHDLLEKRQIEWKVI